MHFCFYRTQDSAEVRMGARAPWDGAVLVDVHLAEVAWLSQRTASRRAYEIAESLVPAQPAAFLAAGAHVWDFAREAVLAATPETTTPRGEPAVVAGRSTRVAILEHLATSAELIDATWATTVGHPVVAVVHRHAHAVGVDDAWDHVAGYVDLAGDATWLLTSDELGDGDSDVYCAVASVVSAVSAGTPLLAGDVVVDPSAVPRARGAVFEELLVSA
jgi:hypothetical protein